MFIEQGPGIRVQEHFTFPWNAASFGAKHSNHFMRTEKEWSKRYETPVKESGLWCELSEKDQRNKSSQNFPGALTLLMCCEGFVRLPCGRSKTSCFQQQSYLYVNLGNLGEVPTFLKLNSQGQPGSLECLPSQWKERGAIWRVIWLCWVNLPLKLPLPLWLEESPADWSEMPFRCESEINPTLS